MCFLKDFINQYIVFFKCKLSGRFNEGYIYTINCLATPPRTWRQLVL
ncbi:hypothetical protein C4K04_0716 [Pseudomonas chlororaphis]|uniref:Uncharacterized protein n=1 Tax=Pseudomonas chlororaphis TaxID=587753 RepID=A0A3G7TJN0_9PSED|nr:hypothetical protein C4K04_0716 [Pseudomonas chlororaphis]